MVYSLPPLTMCGADFGEQVRPLTCLKQKVLPRLREKRWKQGCRYGYTSPPPLSRGALLSHFPLDVPERDRET